MIRNAYFDIMNVLLIEAASPVIAWQFSLLRAGTRRSSDLRLMCTIRGKLLYPARFPGFIY